MGSGAYAPLTYFFVALAVAAFVVEAWAFIDAIIRPAQAFTAAGKQTKTIWLIILGVAFVLGLSAAAYGGVTGILSVAAFVAAAIYLADVRPKVREFRGSNSGTRMGPYGPW
jgi:membrane-bound ClpP family serine protease